VYYESIVEEQQKKPSRESKFEKKWVFNSRNVFSKIDTTSFLYDVVQFWFLWKLNQFKLNYYIYIDITWIFNLFIQSIICWCVTTRKFQLCDSLTMFHNYRVSHFVLTLQHFHSSNVFWQIIYIFTLLIFSNKSLWHAISWVLF